MKSLLPFFARAIPLIVGPALTLVPTGDFAQLGYARRYAFFLLLFIFVGAVKGQLLRMYGDAGQPTATRTQARVGSYRKRPLINRGRDIVDVIVLVALAFLMLASMLAYRESTSPEAFSIALATVLVGAIESRLGGLPSWHRCRALMAFVAGSAIANLSIFVSTNAWLWQMVIIGLAFGAGGAALSLAQAIESGATAEAQSRKVLARLLIISIASGPILLGVLVQLRQLSTPYLLTFLIIPALSPVLTALRAYEEKSTIPPRLTAAVAATILLFVVIVFGVSVLYAGAGSW